MWSAFGYERLCRGIFVCVCVCVRECVHKALMLVKFWFICLKWLRLTIPLDGILLALCSSFSVFLCSYSTLLMASLSLSSTSLVLCCACMQNKEKFHFGDFLFYVLEIWWNILWRHFNADGTLSPWSKYHEDRAELAHTFSLDGDIESLYLCSALSTQKY